MVDHAAHIPGLYHRHANAFDAARSRVLFEAPWLDGLIDGLGPAPRVLDLGCGTGAPLAEYLIAQRCRVTGVDAAPGMIALAQARLPQAEWYLADMTTLDLSAAFDAILAWHSLFHLTPKAQRAMFGVFAAHATPGTRLMFTTGPDAGEDVGTLGGEPLYHASLSPENYRDMLTANGFHLLDHVVADPTCGSATIWLAEARS